MHHTRFQLFIDSSEQRPQLCDNDGKIFFALYDENYFIQLGCNPQIKSLLQPLFDKILNVSIRISPHPTR